MAAATGRPKSENPKTERLFIRVTPQEKQEILTFSDEKGVSLLCLLRKGIEAEKKKKK